MSDNAVIQIEGLGKLYHIGASQACYRTCREAIIESLAAPWRLARRTLGSGIHLAPPSANSIIWALKDVNLEVQQGDILGIIGRNGAGKSTLLKILSRITEPTSGRVKLQGRVGSLLEVGTGFHPELTGRENIFLNGAILGMSRWEIQSKFEEIVEFAEIGKFIDTPLKRYSTGMGTRLAFAVAAHLEPEILLVDEVLAVGDMGFRKKCLGKMKDVSQEGRTVLFVSHEMNAIRRLCSKAVWLDHGRVETVGGVQEVVRNYENSFIGADGNRVTRVERTTPPHSPKWFSCVSLANSSGEPTAAFKYGDTLRLTIGMEGLTPHKSHFVEWFLNERSQGNRVAWGATHAVLKDDLPGDCHQINFEIGPLSLAAGDYSLSLAMGVPAIIDLDFWHEAIVFEVVSSDPQNNGFNYSTNYAPVFISYRTLI